MRRKHTATTQTFGLLSFCDVRRLHESRVVAPARPTDRAAWAHGMKNNRRGSNPEARRFGDLQSRSTTKIRVAYNLKKVSRLVQ